MYDETERVSLLPPEDGVRSESGVRMGGEGQAPRPLSQKGGTGSSGKRYFLENFRKGAPSHTYRPDFLPHDTSLGTCAQAK